MDCWTLSSMVFLVKDDITGVVHHRTMLLQVSVDWSIAIQGITMSRRL